MSTSAGPRPPQEENDFKKMRRFQPCLSYPCSEIDPGLDAGRDEGEARLRRVRPLLRLATKTPGLEHFLDAAHPSSLARLLAPRIAGDVDRWFQSELAHVNDLLLKVDTPDRPRVAVPVATVRVLTIAEADTLSDEDLQKCVPIRNQDAVAMPSLPPLQTARPSIVVQFSSRLFKVIKGAKRRPKLIIDHAGPSSVRFTVESADGSRHENLIAHSLPSSVIDGLFEITQVPAPPPLLLPNAAPRVPLSANEIPEFLQLQLAGFAQIRLRAHVLCAAAGPPGTTRPLWFNTMTVHWRTASRSFPSPTMQVKGYLHPASATCFCGAHLLPPVEERNPDAKFTGRCGAVMTMEMCGQELSPLTDLGCPTHGSKCSKNCVHAPGVCCTNVNVSFDCNHEPVGAWKPYGSSLRPGDPSKSVRKELTMLLGLCAGYHRMAQPLYGDKAPANAAKLRKQLVTETIQELDRRVAILDQETLMDKHLPSDADVGRLDLTALDMLREGGVVQCKLTPSQRAPRLERPDGPALSEQEKKVARSHHWLFPRPGQPYGTLTTLAAPAAPAALASLAAPVEPSTKRQRTNDPNYVHSEMTEYLDPGGLSEALKQVQALLANPELPAKQRNRGVHFLQFLQCCDNEYGDEVDGPLGLPARPLVCKYRARNDGGRLYPTGMPKTPSWHKGEARSVCIQSAPRELRPFMCCRWAHDFDMKNAQPEMLRQMAIQLEWSDGRAPPVMPELERWCADRAEFIEHVANVHDLPTDADRHHEYRKDAIKELVISLMFGGEYTHWVKKLCEEFKRDVADEPLCERVTRLQAELAELRTAVFASTKFHMFAELDRDRLLREGKKESREAIDRSVFARIAQKTENEVLDAMRSFLADHGWTVLTLCFDGLMVVERPQRTLDLAAMNAFILEKTQFVLEVTEKELFSPTFPTLSLARA